MRIHIDSVRRKLDEIADEMGRLGLTEVAAPPPEAYENMGAFGINTMAFPQWLIHILVPRVRGLLATDGPWPSTSMVGLQALREFDGWAEGERLVTLLHEFDELFR
jgi:uncharacterized protein YqcC (DUF446 family)